MKKKQEFYLQISRRLSYQTGLLLLFSIVSSFHAYANDCGPIFDNFTSPLCTNARYIFLTGSLLTAALYATKKNSVYKTREDAVSKQHLQGFSKWGEVVGWGYLNALYIIGNTMFGGKKQSKNAEIMAEASAYTSLATIMLKQTVNEPRPNSPDEMDSFPSGHASMAFAFASVVTARHNWFVGGMSYILASFIGYSRIQDDRHFLHDVIAGATIGMSYGWGVYLNHKKHKKPYWFALAPMPDFKGPQLAIGINF